MAPPSDLSKFELRRQMRQRRRDLAAINPGAAEAAALNLPLDTLPKAAVAGGYHALGAEMNPWPTLRRLADRGVWIALPATIDLDAPLVFRAWDAGQSLAPDLAKIPSPTTEAEAVTPQLVIAPLLAFDRDGYRLGQGGGHYDRTLEALRAKGTLFVIGLGYAGQEVERVPREPHDQPLDAILTEKGYYRIQTKDD